VSELLSMSRQDKQYFSDTGIFLVSVAMSVAIFANMSLDCYFFITSNYSASVVTQLWIPVVFLLLDATIMCVAVYRVWNILKHE